MSRGQRYIFRRILAATVVAAGAVCAIAWCAFGLRLLDKVASGALDAMAFVALSTLPLVGALSALLPVAHLVAAVLVLYRLQLDGETTALSAAGLGRGGIAMPVLASGGAVALAVAAVSFVLGPLASDEARRLRTELRADLGLALVETGRFQQIAPGVTLFVAARTEDGDLTGVMIEEERPGGASVVHIATRASAGSDARGLRLTLLDGTRQERDASGRLTSVAFARLTLSPSAALFADRATRTMEKDDAVGPLDLLRRAIAPLATLAGAVLVSAGLLGGAPKPDAIRLRALAVAGIGFGYLSLALLCAARTQVSATILGLSLSILIIFAAPVFADGLRYRRARG